MSNIIVDNISVSYPIYSASARSFKKSLLGSITGGKIDTESGHTVMINALDNISFKLEKGDRVGLLGHNGAGKSTLLRLLAGIYPPTKGQLTINGKVASILNISLGMNEEATGYENIYIRGLILGLNKSKIKKLIPDIEEFTELGNYLSMPVRTYSNGMKVRLAFAISTSINPEILLLDEVIGVGDASFMAKAVARLNSLVDKANIFLLATHDNEVIKRLCNKALLLSNGKIKFFGEIEQAFQHYQENITESNQ